MGAVSTLVVTGCPEPSLSAAIRRDLERLQPAGLVLFRRNVSVPSELSALTHAIRESLNGSALIAIDQEGGRVARLKEPFTVWPPMRRFGQARSASLARAAGRVIGRELRAVGINCDFAPVLDVDSNPNNPIIGDRAFGGDPGLVGRLGCALTAGLEDSGVLSCGKHFPGHGDTSLDSHLSLPTVDRSSAELRRNEILPFRRAIRAGIPMIMTAHVLYPSLDSHVPATLSRRILHDLLRRELGFRGVTVSDDLAMHALDGYGSIEELSVAAVAAGCDLLLACQSLDDGARAIHALENALRDGRLSAKRVSEALRRVRRMQQRLVAIERTVQPIPDREGALVLARLERRLEDVAPPATAGERPRSHRLGA